MSENAWEQAPSLHVTLLNISGDIHPRLVAAVEEAARLRACVGPSAITETITDLHERMVALRNALDRVEEITATLGRMRSRSVQAASDAQAAYDDAWMEAATKRKVGFAADYASAKERDAAHSAAALEHLLTLRKTQKLERDVAAAFEFTRSVRSHLESRRRDIDTRLRIMTMSTALDR